MASICNDELALSGVLSGHDRKTLSLSALITSTMPFSSRLVLSALSSEARRFAFFLTANQF
ncbi:hypothetical protein C7C56_026830 [Massilia glaciei]|uniref:Uncharacterized protein n=1 Tax=Massilia glaciei TaxID=1524097 RepID=A0A2U2HA31_9BURK|nr:hypothetical protein C7C56_026830 [Massilia glaciei]